MREVPRPCSQTRQPFDVQDVVALWAALVPIIFMANMSSVTILYYCVSNGIFIRPRLLGHQVKGPEEVPKIPHPLHRGNRPSSRANTTQQCMKPG